jgi:hypothetical protein
MTRLTVIALSVAALTAGLAVSEARADKLAIDHTYEVGEKSVLTYKLHEESKAQETVAGDMNMSIASDLKISLAVEPGPDKGEKLVKITLERVLATLTAGEMTKSVDSDKPETLLPEMPLDVLKDVIFDAVLDESGAVQSFTGAEQFVEKAKMKFDGPEDKKEMVTAINTGVRQLFEGPFVYLPDKPVAVGEEWTVSRKVYGLPIMGARSLKEEQVTCRLAKVKDAKAARVAVIELTGTDTVLEGASPTDPKVMTKTGRVEYDFLNGELVSHHLELKGTSKIPMPEDQELKFIKTMVMDTALAPAPKGAAKSAR